MDKIFEKGLLYDFYGDLLTSHQQKIYEDAVYGDLSLGEIVLESNSDLSLLNFHKSQP